MDTLLPFLVLAGVLAAVLGLFTWLAARIRRRGLAGGAVSAALASYEEAFRVTAHESHVEISAQAERRAPLLSPDGHGARGPGGGGVRRRPVGRPRGGRSRQRSRRWTGRRPRHDG